MIVLIAASLLLSLCVWVYLAYDSVSEEPTLQKATTVLRENKKMMAYCAGLFVLLCALSVVLTKVYPDNTVLADLKMITLLALLGAVTVTDLRRHIIPNRVILAGVVLRTVYAAVELLTLGFTAYSVILKRDLLSVLLVAVLLLLGVVVVKNGIGMGDIKLFFIMGLFQGIGGIISSLSCSLLIALIAAIVLLITKKKSRKDSMAFAPAIMAGTAISMFLMGV